MTDQQQTTVEEKKTFIRNNNQILQTDEGKKFCSQYLKKHKDATVMCTYTDPNNLSISQINILYQFLISQKSPKGLTNDLNH
jgi:hypothetical protein